MTTLNSYLQNSKDWKKYKKTTLYETELEKEIDIKFY